VRSSHQYIEGEIATHTGQKGHAQENRCSSILQADSLLSKEKRAMERILRDDADSTRKGDIILKWFRYSLQLLALDAQAQIAHFPTDLVHVTDEMVLDFNHWERDVRTYWLFSQEQEARLAALKSCLNKIWRDNPHNVNPAFWEEEALFTDSQWEELRTQAKAVLASFEWPVEVPPPYQSIRYVEGVGVVGDIEW
jgi:hypothetical protein